MIVFEFLFDTLCGWIGYVVVKGITFGKIDLEWGSSSESVVAEFIGLGILLGAGALIIHPGLTEAIDNRASASL